MAATAQLGDRVWQDQIEVNGKPLGRRSAPVYLAYYKPAGPSMSTTDEAEPDRIAPGGRGTHEAHFSDRSPG